MTNADDSGPGIPSRSRTTEMPDEGGQYDADLGKRMARDARRVSDGDLSEAAFYEKYHEEVVEEFGRDERPVETGSDT